MYKRQVVCALKVLQKIGYKISDSDIENGIKEATLPARMEVVSEKPLVILDGGHNEDCIIALKKAVETYLSGRKTVFLMAFMKDKDYTSAITHIAPLCDRIVFTNIDKIRGERTEILETVAKKYCRNVSSCDDALSAFEKTLADIDQNSVLFVAGSFYLSSEIRNKYFS